jgi:hypothetical protein
MGMLIGGFFIGFACSILLTFAAEAYGERQAKRDRWLP